MLVCGEQAIAAAVTEAGEKNLPVAEEEAAVVEKAVAAAVAVE